MIAFDCVLKVFHLIDFGRGEWKYDVIRHFNPYEVEVIVVIASFLQLWINSELSCGGCVGPKVRVFLWQLYNNILPTQKSLHRRVPSVLRYCPICSSHEEDVEHVFFQCRLPEETWSCSPYSHLWGLLHGSASSILERIMDWSEFDSAQFSYLLWSIWNSRNNLIFRQLYLVLAHIVLQAFGLAAEYFRLHHRSGGSPNDDPSLVVMLSGRAPMQDTKGKASVGIRMVYMEVTSLTGIVCG